MIDFHSHVLPGIDDGASHSRESIKILSDSYSQGISLCVATPHITVHDESSIENFIFKRDAAAKQLQTKIIQTEIKTPKLLLGAEVLLDSDISELRNLDKLCIENTSLMLIELPTAFYSKHFPEWLYSISVKGIDLILAHVERYMFLDKLMYELDGTDITYQVNASTLLSFSGRRFLRNLCQTENSILVSSDVHNTTFRKNHMLDAYNKITKKSKELADILFETNAERLLIESSKQHKK